MFIVFGGLPGTGKSTIARELAERLPAVYLRIDTVEQAIWSSGVLTPGTDMGPAGYLAACDVAADNLAIGLSVIADSVNPLRITRDFYRDVAARAGAGLLEVEIVCSGKAQHRQRVEARLLDPGNRACATWEQVEARRYEAWDRAPLRIDTATVSAAQGVDLILEALPATPDSPDPAA